MQDGYDQTLSGLLRKRAELAATIATTRAQLDNDLAALDAIEAAIRVFNPELAGEYLPLNRTDVPHQSVTSEIRRFLLDQMRTRENGAVQTLQAAAEIMRVKGLDPRDRVVATLIRKRVTDALRRMRQAGMIEGRRFGSGSELEWRLVD